MNINNVFNHFKRKADAFDFTFEMLVREKIFLFLPVLIA